MIFDRKVPLYLKLFTGIDGHVHIFLAPILIFLISKDVRLSGIYYVVDGLIRFLSYSLAGNVCEIFNLRKMIRFSYFMRFFFVLNAILIYLYYPYKYIFLIINNLGFIFFNCHFVTSFEILYQKNYQYNQRIQSLISAGDLCGAGLAISSILIFMIFKINLIYYALILPIVFAIGFRFLFVKTNKTMSFKRKMKFFSIFKEIKTNFKELYLVVKGDKTFVFDTIVGYFPFIMILLLEQFYIFEFSAKYSDDKMKVIYYIMKSIAFFSSSLLIPVITMKVKNIKSTLVYSLILYLIGFIFAIQTEYLVLRISGLLLITYSHYFVFNYRMIKRRETMIKNKLSFHSLGLFLAIEGLGTIIANLLLSFFGKSYAMLTISGLVFFFILMIYAFKQYGFVFMGKKRSRKAPFMN